MRRVDEVLHRLGDVAWTARTATGRRALTTWRPRSLAGYRLAAALRDDGRVPASVVDVGANVGQFARAATEVFDGPVVHSFEPLPSAAAQFRANLDDARHVRLHEVAVGGDDGRTSLYEHDYPLASSLRPMAGVATGARATEQIGVLDVELTRLDTVLADVELPRPCLLKIDVQGTESDVLAGAADTLDRVDWIVLELTFSPVYAGEPLFAELDHVLEATGWRLRWPIATLPSAGGGHIVQMDALYDRHDGSAR